MAERKRRRSQNNHLLREIMERLRDYEPEEVIIICNKYRTRRNLPPLAPDFLEKLNEAPVVAPPDPPEAEEPPPEEIALDESPFDEPDLDEDLDVPLE